MLFTIQFWCLGKSLFISRCRQAVQQAFDGKEFWQNTILRFLDKSVSSDDVVETIYTNKDVVNTEPHFIHIDATPCVSIMCDREPVSHMLYFYETIIFSSVGKLC